MQLWVDGEKDKFTPLSVVMLPLVVRYRLTLALLLPS